ncbi:MAG: LemA protein [Zhongshania aliphaticivorans]|jgi:LemA protein|uniref:LemA family protein n=1 Tax=Zhongshania aliphaticivorans TaxID=1470434 RepID=A0A127M362_9GAMM|nr:LemA family protein [Zhongshania aliphaticivorans]AMO67662.1 LemA family protein [Zhongshania aliphaticivorans]EIF44894.1 LemA family protein [gamma proteobacterium BDW918]|tara:strand:+ start:446 stop:1018 length:573 start_codon:yes stop_codon:yes gene_type:complete
MEIGLIISLAVVLFSIFYLVMLYNGLVSLKHAVSKHLANIDVLLKQRHDELPKLIETCKQYMKHEQETLSKVITARQQVSVAQSNHDIIALGQAETNLRASTGQLFALAENYPELKADSSFAALQNRISELENAIADRREVYNEAVNNNNVRIEQFPDVIIARWFRFHAFDLLKFAKSEVQDVDIKSLFN